MLRIKRIDIHNFGPFIDQSIVFDDKPGVSIIWGANGSGKTTLVEIIKYALYGKYFEENNKETSKIKTLNREALHRKEFEFHVTMAFLYDGSEYSLCRMQKVQKAITEPKDSDFDESLTLSKDGITLSQNETAKILNHIMPEDISRFFMFDGEIISNYTRILSESNPDEEGRKIRETIEKILGLPALKDCAKNIRMTVDAYEEKISMVETEDKQQKNYQELIAKYKTKVDSYESSLKELETRIANLNLELETVQGQMETYGDLGKIIEKKKSAENEREITKENLENEKERLRGINENLWRSLLHERCIEALDSIVDEYDELTQRVSLDYIIKKSQETGICLICQRPLDNNHNLVIQVSDDDKSRKRQLDKIKGVLEPIANAEPSYKQLTSAERRIFSYEDELERLDNKISEYENRLNSSNFNPDEVEGLPQKRDDLLRALYEANNARTNCQDELNKAKATLDSIHQKLKEGSTGELNRLYNRRDICQSILDVLNQSIEDYCQKLKQNIQRDATKIFQTIIKGGKFEGHELLLQDNYSLQLLFTDGSVVPRRSAGYEKIIALSLLAGIHNNAPIEGPTFIDSPFSKLDENNRKNIPDTFVQMGDQVILLLYRGEIPEKDLKESLGNKLLREYELKHESQYSTIIEGGGQ